MDTKKDWMDTKQDWKGLDGAIAWHFIERQAENWTQVGEMMNEWLKANAPTKEWVGLTEYEIKGVLGLSESWVGEDCSIPDMIGFAKAIEAKLKDKNN